MTLHLSTGLRNKMLDTGSMKSTMALGKIKIYSGPVPTTADVALDPSNVLLCTITVSSGATGISLDTAAVGGIISKASEVWSGVNAATGTATYFRHVAVGDDGTLSTTQARIQGDVAVFGAELNLSSVSLTSGATQTIDVYSLSLPTT